MTSSPLSIFKGSMESIKEKMPDIIDGQLFFAVDTKQIYLDYDVDNGVLDGPERIKFGGSTGIWYGNKTDESDAGQVVFRLSQLEEATEYPSAKDLILNSDGSFFKVTEVDSANDEIIAVRLTVSGGGGGGGGGTSGSSYIDYKRVGVKNRYFSIQDDQMLLTFQAYSTAGEDTEMGATIYLVDAAGIQHTLGTINNIGQSWGTEDPLTIDLKPLLANFNYSQNIEYGIEISVFDDVGNTSLKTIPYTVTIFDMQVKAVKASLGTWNGDPYRCIPIFFNALENVQLFFKVINIAYGQTVQTNYPDEGIVLKSADNNNEQIININSDIPVGSYKIQTWIRAAIPKTNGMTIVESNPLEQTFIRQSADSSDPILSVNFPSSSIDYKQYAMISIPYMISYRNASISVNRTVEFTNQEGVTTKKTESLEQATETNLTWDYRLMELGSYKFTIQVGANTMNASTSDLYYVNTVSAEIPTTTTAGLVLNLTANKDNDASDRESWTSVTPAQIVSSRLTGFNWISNGWRTINGETSLYLNNGAKLEVLYSPFKTAAEENGVTIEFDVKISNIRDRHAELIKCISRDNDGTLHTGTIVNGDYFTLNSSAQKPIEDYNELGYINLSRAGMTATYVPGKRVRISFVITPDGRSPYSGMASNMVCTYVNGVLSGFVAYGEDTFLGSNTQNSESGKFVFDSTNADIDIYNLRVYQTALSDRAILGNYFASFADFQEAAEKWDDNAILTDEGEISLEQVIAKKNIPYLLMRGGITVDGKKGKNFITPLSTGLPTSKKDYKLVDVCYIDPENPENNIGSLDSKDRVEWVIYAQGTSSMEYPIKNLRSKFARDNIDDTYQLFDDLPGVDLFCFKVDYMESSSAHNTGLGNMLNELYGGIKPPSRLITDTDENGEAYDYVTAIKGKPCVIFFKETSTDPRVLRTQPDSYQDYKYIGRYNFNLDKSTHEPFGFYSDYDRHYGVAIQDPPALNDSYEENLGKAKVIDGLYHATLDANPEQGKKYYKDPQGKVEWKWEEIAEYDSKEDEWVWTLTSPAYEFRDKEGTNSIQVWECLDNNKPLTHFTQAWTEASDPDCALWVENFESRYPEYEVQEMADKRDLQRLVNWIADTNCIYTTSYEVEEPKLNDKGEQEYDEEGNPIYVTKTMTDYHLHSNEPSLEDIEAGNIPDDLTPLIPGEGKRPAITAYSETTGKVTYANIDGYYYDSYEYRLYKFRKEFDNYFERNLTLVYYIISEFLLMTDSRAKNMMLCTFTAQCTDANGESKTKWFPIFYDMDTGLAVNNMGQLKFTYKDEDWYEDIFNAEAGYVNQNGTINKSYSALWANIQLTMYDHLKTVYATLRDGAFNYEYLLNGYNKNQADKWNETYINKDAYIKYVEPYVNPTSWKVMIDACQGTRSLHREQFLQRRFLYMDSKYVYIKSGMGLSLRVNDLQKHPGDIFNFNLTTNDAMYLVSQFGNEQPVRSEHVIDENTTVNISTRAPSGGQVGEQPYYLYLINNVRSFGDMSDMGIQTFDPFQKAPEIPADPAVVYENDLKLENLILSTNEEAYEYELKKNNRMAALNIVKYFPMLKDLNVGYWNNLGTLDLRYNKNLKTLEAFGTKLSSCQFPQGGVLEHLQLPATLNRISLVGHYNLDTIEYKEYSSDYENDQVNINITASRENAWDKLIGLSIEQCPKLDTKAIFKQMKPENLQIYLPDINWTLDSDEFTVSNGMITEIPILEKLLLQVGYNGELRDNDVLDEYGQPTYNEDGNKITVPATNRSYVGGHILIKNGTAGVDEALMYQKYTRYYPLIDLEVDNWNDNCIRAYSLNTHDANGELMVGNSPKFTSENVEAEFTLDKVFGNATDGILIEPIGKAPTNEYIFEFRGWNTEGVLTYTERDYKTADNTVQDSINAAENACAEKLIIAWDGENYSAVNGFDFTKVFSDTVQELNIYPTFVATVRSWKATFTDGLGNIVEEQTVRYGENAVVPDLIPLKLELNPDNVAETYSYPFLRYGTANETYIIVNDKTFEAVYSTSKQPMQNSPTSDAWFTIDNSAHATLLSNYTAEAICVPKTVKGVTVNGITIKNPNVKRVYFENKNEITLIGYQAFQNMTQLEYVDLYNLQSLYQIDRYAFDGCKEMVTSEFYAGAPLTSIGEGAFSGCQKLNITTLPIAIQELVASAFSQCKGLSNFDLRNCTSLKTIPSSCFAYCDNLRLIGDDLPENVTKVGSRAFIANTNLVLNFDHSNKLVEIESSAFERTPALTLSNLPSSLTTIRSKAFAGSASVVVSAQILKFSKLPASLQTIEAQAFNTRTLESDILDLSECTQLTNIANNAFTGLQGVVDIWLPLSLQSSLVVPADRWGAGADVQIVYK